MRNCLYEKEGYTIFQTSYGYVLYNTNKEFEDGHTHLEQLESGISLIELCVNKRIPNTRTHYVLSSLIRITDDSTYKQSLMTLLGLMAKPKKSTKKKSKRRETKPQRVRL